MKMLNYVLVHPAQCGGWAWKFVAENLRKAGHRVWAPSLTGLGDRNHLARSDVNLNTHIMDTVNLIEFEDLEEVVLVGWSYGGMVVTGTADQIPEKISHMIYLDAEVPRDGESLFDLNGPEFREMMETSAQKNGDGWLASFGDTETLFQDEREWIPNDELRRWYVEKVAASPQPIETYRQPVRLSNTKRDRIPRTFVRMPENGSMFDLLFAPIVNRFNKNPEWNYIEIPTNHCGPVVDPDLVSKTLTEIP
jgi:pimeloyl-ACP methyl ester carboxylesterase